MSRAVWEQLAAECAQELNEHILPFWLNLKDPRGGFYGQVTHALELHKDAPKGIILHARILWAFSAAYLRFPEQKYLDAAAHACDFLRTAWDLEQGGFYWSLTADGKPFETDKYAYCNAFCIYGLACYAEASGDKEALELAKQAFACIEKYFAQPDGYLEVFDVNWMPLENDHLSEHDLHAAKTMNTTLHLIEAYAELYRLTKDAAVGTALRKLLVLTANSIYDPAKEMLEVFFDDAMTPIGDLHSFGHDIEASWLINHACDCLGDASITKKFRKIGLVLANHVYKAAFREGALYNERFEQTVDRTKVWWVQAEGIVGFLNAAQTASEQQDSAAAEVYLDAAAQLWEFVKAHQIDRREGGEWFAEIDENGEPHTAQDMAGIWKCPYHNSRMCLEVINRSRQYFE